MATKSIMVVEDNPINGKVIRLLLTNAGYDVRLISDAEEALRVLETWQPRLILIDIQLPGMDGLELTRLLKSNPKTCTIRIVALTAYAMKGDDAKALTAGCDGYISKPIDFQTCLEQVARHWAATT
jgi:two-component system cell cycle response regulator DivK